jgi:hypothetical protein
METFSSLIGLRLVLIVDLDLLLLCLCTSLVPMYFTCYLHKFFMGSFECMDSMPACDMLTQTFFVYYEADCFF